MFLSIKEMELRKIRFDETFAPGDLNFEEDEIRQAGPLHAEGTAELLANTEGEVRIQGRLTVEMETECDRCLGRALFPLDARFDLFYRPAVSVAGQDEVEIDEGKLSWASIRAAVWSWKMYYGSRSCWSCRCSGFAARIVKGSVPRAAPIAMKRRAAASQRPPMPGGALYRV